MAKGMPFAMKSAMKAQAKKVAMKVAMKNVKTVTWADGSPTSKGKVSKGKSSPRRKASPKANPKMSGSKKTSLTQKNLQKHGKQDKDLTLDEKLEKLRKSEDPQEDAKHLLSKLDRSKLWNRAATAGRKDPEIKATQEQAKNKHDKGLITLALALDPKKGTIWDKVTKTLTVKESVTKKEEWLTWEEIVTKKGEPAVTAWLESGRVVWRLDQVSGIYEYMDTQSVVKLKQVERSKDTSKYQEDLQMEDKADEIETMLEEGFSDLLVSELGNTKGKGKGHAIVKSAGSAKGKGAGKGRGKVPKAGPLALLDKAKDDGEEEGEEGQEAKEDPEEKEAKEYELALSKTRSMQLLLMKCEFSLEEAFAPVKKSSFMSKGLETDIKEKVKDLDKHKLIMRNIMSKKKESAEQIKQHLKNAAAFVVAINDIVKKLKILDAQGDGASVSSKKPKK